MTSGSLLWLTVGGLFLATLTATGARVLDRFSRHELEEYCRRKKRPELFDDIIKSWEQFALAAESLQMLSLAVLLMAGSLWLFPMADRSSDTERLTLLASIGVATLVGLVATSWIPWAVVRLWSAPFLFHTWRIWWVASRVGWPLSVGVGIVAALFHRLAGRRQQAEDAEEAFEDEIRNIVSTGQSEGLLEADAREMIEGVISLDDLDVGAIMTPRSRVDAFDISLTWSEVCQFVVQVGRTRIPVYDKTLDQIVGILFVKDLLGELTRENPEQRKPLRQLLREPWFVPETKAVDEMLQDFLRVRSHLAIVMDEYGSVVGVVTIEDILEEIVGEIVDETDPERHEEIRMINDRVAEVLGHTSVDDVNQRLGVDLPDRPEFDTVAGFVLDHLGDIPKQGQMILVDNLRIEITEANRRRIDKMRIEILDEPPATTVGY